MRRTFIALVALGTGVAAVAGVVGFSPWTAGPAGVGALPSPAAAGALADTPSCPSPSVPSGDGCMATFTYTGAPQTFTIPSGVSSVSVAAQGAAGGGVVYGFGPPAGYGGEESGTIPVQAGKTVTILVGGAGWTAPEARGVAPRED